MGELGSHLSGDLLTPSPRQGDQAPGRQDETGQASTRDGAGHLAEYRDAAQRAGTVGNVVGSAGERHEHIAGDRIYRDRMRT